MRQPVPFDQIRDRIVVLRGYRVMLSNDLAELYGVEAKVLVQAVKRNLARFPDDFLFQLTSDEWRRLRSAPTNQVVDGRNLKSQVVTSRWGGARKPPTAFTEHGVAMLSSVLKSRRAIEVNVEIVRTFVRLRQWIQGNRDLKRKVAELERKYDGQFKIVFEALQELMEPPPTPPRKQIGFKRSP